MNPLTPVGRFSHPHSAPRLLVAGPDSRRMSDFIDCLNRLEASPGSPLRTGGAALSRARETSPDLVFLDLDLPGAPIFDIADQVRESCGAPVIFLGEVEQLEKISKSRLSLPFGYLAPPFSAKTLRRMMSTVLYAAGLEKRLKIAEQARQEWESKYHLLADNVTDVIFITDLNLAYTYISPSIKRTRGYDPEELIGKSAFEMLTPNSRNDVLRKFEKAMDMEAAGKSDPRGFQMVEVEVYRKDGTAIWIESKVSFLRDENLRPVGLIGINRDITERRLMVDRLRESEEKFRALAEGCPFAIMIYQDDYWVYANPAAEPISGYSREEFYRMRFWEIVHPDYQPLVRDRGAKRQAGQAAPPAYDFKIIHKTGREIWVSLSGSSLSYGGKPAGLITVIDITERKKAEAALKESETRYRTILESIEDGYYEVDLKGNFTFFNDMLCRISGYSRQEIVGVNYRNSTDAESAVRMRETFARVFETGIPAPSFAIRIIQKDGGVRHVEISVSLIQDLSGKISGFRGIVRDVSDRVLAEENKRKLEAQLRHAQKMEAIGTLAGGIAHDFNNILQAINGYAQLLLLNKSPDHPDARKLLQIQQSGERAGRLIQQLLTFSRKMEGSPRLLSLNHELRQAEELLRQTVPKMIAIELNLDDGIPAINADPMHIEQILLNLGSNAADAMPNGGRLTIETRKVDLDEHFCSDHMYAIPGSYVRLTVADTGAGMDAATVAHIFDPFFTTKEAGKGTGLGLASVYGIVKTLRGYILCYSEPGRGSVFKIYLPAGNGKSVDEGASPPEKMLMGGMETILVVDDEAVIRETAGEMLAYHGYQVLFAENGESALETFHDRMDDIDLVIMDISMPGMGGYQCMREMIRTNPSAKVIIASGYATTGHAREAMELGAAGFIGKPYHIADIIVTVREVLDRV